MHNCPRSAEAEATAGGETPEPDERAPRQRSAASELGWGLVSTAVLALWIAWRWGWIWALAGDRFEVTVAAEVAERARLAVQRMIDLPPPAQPARYDLVRARHHVDVELI